MYMSRVLLKNIRCFEQLEIEFEKRGSSIIVTGDNGDGKSTLLRSVAMGLCDESSAAALLRELSGDFVRKGEDEAIIDIFLVDNKYRQFRIETIIRSQKAYEKVKQRLYVKPGRNSEKFLEAEEDTFPWQRIFVSSYGAGIRTNGTADFQHYFAVDAVYPLFKYDVPLQNPELAVRRLIAQARRRGGKDSNKSQEYAEKMWASLQELLATVLNLKNKNDVRLKPTGLTVRRSSGEFELGALGDGYKAMTTWVMDLLSWKMLHRTSTTFRDLSGIVLIDEVEKHLHPRWQTTVMHTLRDIFPKIQFVATTHSPLVVTGAEGISVLPLNIEPPQIRRVGGWLAEDVYRDILGLSTSRPPHYQKLISRYEFLHNLKLRGQASDSEKRQLRKLRKELRTELPGNDPVSLSAQLANLAKILDVSTKREQS